MRRNAAGQVMARARPGPVAIVERQRPETETPALRLVPQAAKRPVAMLIAGIGGLGAASGMERDFTTFQFRQLHL